MKFKAWSAAQVNDLPDSSFLYIEPGGTKDESGKTKPRSLRHLPYKNAGGTIDLPHLRNAISRLGQSNTGKGWLSAALRKRLQSKAQGILKRHKKEIDMDEEMDTEIQDLETKDQSEDAEKMRYYTSAKNFEEYEQEEEAREIAYKTRETAEAISVFAGNIINDPMEEDKPSAISQMLDQAKAKFNSLFGKTTTKEVEPEETVEGTKAVRNEAGLLITKNAAGEYVWVARYSNNTRDNDSPPEIIAAKSHKRFVEMVDKGIYPMPELWLWHNKDWKFGEATVVDFDEETGFAIAAGRCDKGKEWVAEAIAGYDPTKTRLSHGMPNANIVRDSEDPTIIIEHQTKEISWLPSWAAANKLTGFTILTAQNKEKDMINPEKAQNINDMLGITPEQLGTLEAANKADKARVDKEGIETKEKAQPEEVVTPEAEVPAEEVTEPEAEPKTETAEPEEKESVALTPQDVVDAVKMVFEPIAARLETVESQLKELSASDEEKIQKEVAVTPRDSLFASMASVIGNPEAQIDGRTKEAKGPKETTVPEGEGFANAIPFLRDLDNWRGSFKEISQ